MSNLIFANTNRSLKPFSLAVALGFCTVPVLVNAAGSELSSEPKPMQIDEVPDRVPPLIEIGDRFLGAGNISAGFEIPTGAVWQPSFVAWGEVRSGAAYVDYEPATGDEQFSEWANRIDLFGQLTLSQADRIVVGVRSFDEDGEFFGRRFEPEEEDIDPTLDVSLAFIEVNLAELFPKLNGGGVNRPLDLDLSIGRQQIFFQEGTIVNDNMDSIALARNNLSLLGNNNTRVAFVYAWNEVNRSNNIEDEEADFFGIFTESDFAKSTVNLDFATVNSDETGDGYWLGISAIQRFGKLNTAFRAVHSEPGDDETSLTTGGTLLVSEMSWVPAHTFDNVYINLFYGIDEFQPASRDLATGGPLGIVGISFAAVGLGGYGAPLSNDAIESFGGALGYQMFFANNRRQLILELGARDSYDEDAERTQVALAARYQHALGRRFIARLDGFVAERQNFDSGWGARTEILVRF